MNHSPYFLIACLLLNIQVYGIGYGTITVVTQTTRTVMHPSSWTTTLREKTLAHWYVLRKKANHLRTHTVQYVNDTRTHLEERITQFINDQRARAVEAYLRAQVDAARDYVTENPIKSALMTVGAGAIAYGTCKAISALYCAIHRYHTSKTVFCACCGNEIDADQATGTDVKHSHLCLCKNCHDCLERTPLNTPHSYHKAAEGK